MLTFSIPAGQAANWAADIIADPRLADMEGVWWNMGEDVEHYVVGAAFAAYDYGEIYNGQKLYQSGVGCLFYDIGAGNIWTIGNNETPDTATEFYQRSDDGLTPIADEIAGDYYDMITPAFYNTTSLEYAGGWWYWRKNSESMTAYKTASFYDAPGSNENVYLQPTSEVTVCGPVAPTGKINVPTGIRKVQPGSGYYGDLPFGPPPETITPGIVTLEPIPFSSMTAYPELENNGGGEGDPHCEGFDRPFDFHGKSGRCYQMYKGDKLRINIKMSHAYHCVENGTFISEIYVSGTQNGKGYEALWAVNGVADVSGVFKSIPLPNKPLLGAYAKDVSEFKNGNWVNEQAVKINDDTVRITLTRSRYLGQWCVNFRITPKIMEKDAKGIIGQTWNMKLRLPNELFEVKQINSEDIMRVITPDMYFPVEIGVK